MRLGLINSAWSQAGRGTAFGIRKTKEIGFDCIDVFADPLDVDARERRLIRDECARARLPIVSPPCVAADVAFDAILKAYEPTELIGLQYHLHIPGPDPLTNTDSIARQSYYGELVRGTPSSLLNGRPSELDGGMMGDSEERYKELRGLIGEILEKKARADVTVAAKLEGDRIALGQRQEVIHMRARPKADGAPTQGRGRLLVRYHQRSGTIGHHRAVRATQGTRDQRVSV